MLLEIQADLECATPASFAFLLQAARDASSSPKLDAGHMNIELQQAGTLFLNPNKPRR